MIVVGIVKLSSIGTHALIDAVVCANSKIVFADLFSACVAKRAEVASVAF
jgi:hypothetical protein